VRSVSRYTDGAPGDRPSYGDSDHQKVLNQRWPYVDTQGRRHAEGIPDRQPIDVDVRLELERDGEVWVPGAAHRWTRTHVYVTSLNEPRVLTRAVWVLAADVRRR
jgi:hypothetical protein